MITMLTSDKTTFFVCVLDSRRDATVADAESPPTLTSETTIAGGSTTALLPLKGTAQSGKSRFRCGRPVTKSQWRLVYVVVAVLVVVVIAVAVAVSV